MSCPLLFPLASCIRCPGGTPTRSPLKPWRQHAAACDASPRCWRARGVVAAREALVAGQLSHPEMIQLQKIYSQEFRFVNGWFRVIYDLVGFSMFLVFPSWFHFWVPIWVKSVGHPVAQKIGENGPVKSLGYRWLQLDAPLAAWDFETIHCGSMIFGQWGTNLRLFACEQLAKVSEIQ